MNHLDTSWCPVCSRQILPKRYLVPVTQQQPSDPSPIPAPPPSSPTASEDTSPRHPPPPRQARRTGTIRPKGAGGLVRGTGRVNPNGAIKRSDSKREAASPVPPVLPLVAPVALKQRTVIDQNPTPLYCSDECRLEDLNTMYGGLSLDYNPDRDPRGSPTLPPVPHNSFSTIPAITDDSDSSSPSTSPESLGCSLATEHNPFSADVHTMSPSIAALARIYDFPPLPPRPAMLDDESRGDAVDFDNNYQSGVMMAARRIKETLCSRTDSTTRTVSAFGQGPKDRKPIPGWTDGSDSWRSSVYSLASPNAPISSTSLSSRDERPAAYSSFVASPHRSTGVYSTIGENNTPTASVPSTGSSRLTSAARANTSDDLYSKYALAFSRRSDSRPSLSGSAPQAQSFPALSRRREQSILKPGAEGKLLVPDVKLKASSTSSFSNDGASVSSWRSSSTRSCMRSPLSRQGSEVSVDSDSDVMDTLPAHEQPCSMPAAKRPSVDTRSWSYDSMTTYPVMPMPPRKEIRYERRVVDGVTTVVETEVEVQPQLKRLFLFPGKERR